MAGIGLLVVRSLSPARSKGMLYAGSMRLPCALGRSGRTVRKREGDGGTPVGVYAIARVLYRPDRATRPRTRLPIFPIRSRDGWCDQPGDRNYNRSVLLPYPASCERLWREDHLYDLVVVLDHNTRPRLRGGGSAIFLHVARPGYAPTEGCIALQRRHLERILGLLRRGARIKIMA